MTLILLELVTLFLVFYLGARFGPDLIGSRQEVAQKETTSEEESGKPKEVSLTYPELLTDQTEGAIRVKPSGVTAKEMVEREAPIIVPLEEEKVPVIVEKKPDVVEPAPREIEKGKYSIQVGSYQSSNEATTQMERWRGKGYSTFMTVGEIPNKGTWYRVRIGHFGNQEEAKGFLKRFKEKEKTNALVVPSKS
ncbi:MAG: SPOR domain-containing protein [Deltaproteobacteria bacterium]|nr:SPOR domain-containing protein [Deltaproteobacteria bacterium]